MGRLKRAFGKRGLKSHRGGLKSLVRVSLALSRFLSASCGLNLRLEGEYKSGNLNASCVRDPVAGDPK